MHFYYITFLSKQTNKQLLKSKEIERSQTKQKAVFFLEDEYFS